MSNDKLTTAKQTTSNASKLIKKRQLMSEDLRPATDRNEAKPTLINKIGKAIANYDRTEIATTVSKAVGNFAENVTYQAVNDTLFTGERAVVDTVETVAVVTEGCDRKIRNGSSVLVEAITVHEQNRLEDVQAKIDAAAKEVAQSSGHVALEVKSRATGYYQEKVVSPREAKRALKIQKIQDNGGTRVQKTRKWVAGYTGKPVYGEQSATIQTESGESEMLQLSEVTEPKVEPQPKKNRQRQMGLSDAIKAEMAS